MRKNIIALFKNEGLSITIETNLFEKNFSDITLSLVTRKIYHIREPSDQPFYFNTKSNHPPTIIRYLSNMINKGCQVYLAKKKSMKEQNHFVK